jgi:hypothetical protein
VISDVRSLTVTMLAAGLSAGCASQADQVTAQAQPVCEKEYRMGSNIPVVTCSTPLTAEERQRVAEQLKSVVRTVPPGGGAAAP